MVAGKIVVSPALGGDTLFRPYSLFTVGGGGGNGEGGEWWRRRWLLALMSCRETPSATRRFRVTPAPLNTLSSVTYVVFSTLGKGM